MSSSRPDDPIARAIFVHSLHRPDGRPEAYDLTNDYMRVTCIECAQDGHFAKFKRGEAVMCSPADASDQQTHIVCIAKHVPEDIVIFDPVTGKCRDKSGQNVWVE